MQLYTLHKATTIKALARRAQLICHSPDALQNESDNLQRVFLKQIQMILTSSNLSISFPGTFFEIGRAGKLITYKNNEHIEINNPTTVTSTIPYIKGTSEIISRILRPYNIRVAHKLTTTLWHILTNVKDKEQPYDRPGPPRDLCGPGAK